MSWDDVFQILAYGLLPAATGGLYIDKDAPHLINILHIYAWITLVVVPLAIDMTSSAPLSLGAKLGYAFAVTAVFGLIQFINAQLHKVFDRDGDPNYQIAYSIPASNTTSQRQPGQPEAAAQAAAEAATSASDGERERASSAGSGAGSRQQEESLSETGAEAAFQPVQGERAAQQRASEQSTRESTSSSRTAQRSRRSAARDRPPGFHRLANLMHDPFGADSDDEDNDPVLRAAIEASLEEYRREQERRRLHSQADMDAGTDADDTGRSKEADDDAAPPASDSSYHGPASSKSDQSPIGDDTQASASGDDALVTVTDMLRQTPDEASQGADSSHGEEAPPAPHSVHQDKDSDSADDGLLEEIELQPQPDASAATPADSHADAEIDSQGHPEAKGPAQPANHAHAGEQPSEDSEPKSQGSRARLLSPIYDNIDNVKQQGASSFGGSGSDSNNEAPIEDLRREVIRTVERNLRYVPIIAGQSTEDACKLTANSFMTAFANYQEDGPPSRTISASVDTTSESQETTDAPTFRHGDEDEDAAEKRAMESLLPPFPSMRQASSTDRRLRTRCVVAFLRRSAAERVIELRLLYLQNERILRISNMPGMADVYKRASEQLMQALQQSRRHRIDVRRLPMDPDAVAHQAETMMFGEPDEEDRAQSSTSSSVHEPLSSLAVGMESEDSDGESDRSDRDDGGGVQGEGRGHDGEENGRTASTKRSRQLSPEETSRAGRAEAAASSSQEQALSSETAQPRPWLHRQASAARAMALCQFIFLNGGPRARVIAPHEKRSGAELDVTADDVVFNVSPFEADRNLVFVTFKGRRGLIPRECLSIQDECTDDEPLRPKIPEEACQGRFLVFPTATTGTGGYRLCLAALDPICLSIDVGFGDSDTYVLSLKDDKKSIPFGSLDALIEFYQNNPLPLEEGQNIELTEPILAEEAGPSLPPLLPPRPARFRTDQSVPISLLAGQDPSIQLPVYSNVASSSSSLPLTDPTTSAGIEASGQNRGSGPVPPIPARSSRPHLVAHEHPLTYTGHCPYDWSCDRCGTDFVRAEGSSSSEAHFVCERCPDLDICVDCYQRSRGQTASSSSAANAAGRVGGDVASESSQSDPRSRQRLEQAIARLLQATSSPPPEDDADDNDTDDDDVILPQRPRPRRIVSQPRYRGSTLDRRPLPSGVTGPSTPQRPKPEWRLPLLGTKLKLPFNRMLLVTLLDCYKNPLLLLTAVALMFATAFLGCEIARFYHDLGTVVLWMVVAAAQYSLYRSVQPDPASSIVGDPNSAISRPIHFCILAAAALAFDHASGQTAWSSLSVYTIPFHSSRALELLRDIVLVVILCLPAIHTLGVLPSWKTSLHHILEQTDIHVLGGNGTTSLLAAAFNVVRSSAAVAVLFGLAVAAMQDREPGDVADSIFFSLFSGLAVALSMLVASVPSDTPEVFHHLRVNRQQFQQQKAAAAAAAAGGSTGQEDADSEQDIDAKIDSARFRHRSSQILVQALLLLPVFAVVFAIHATGLFTAAQPDLTTAFASIVVISGTVVHSLLPSLKQPYPWKTFGQPLLGTNQPRARSNRSNRRLHFALSLDSFIRLDDFVETHVLLPLFLLSAMSQSAQPLKDKFGPTGAAFLMALCSFKLLRARFGNRLLLMFTVAVAMLVFQYDFVIHSETVIVDLFVIAIAVWKGNELLNKLRFVATFNAPWNLKQVAASSFHAAAYPLTIPHAICLITQSTIATVLSAPIYPFMGSSIFLVSYFRPLCFWERSYRTRRLDNTNMRMDQLERGVTSNSLDSLYYEHIVYKLELNLARDVAAGKWGNACAGDIFVMRDVDNNMTALLMIVETGEGYVSFQLRGLERTATYCHARETEALDEDINNLDDNCCCCGSGCGRVSCGSCSLLPFASSMNHRWQVWQHVAHNYKLPGYSISYVRHAFVDRSSRSRLTWYLCQAIIYYLGQLDGLDALLADDEVKRAVARARDSDPAVSFRGFHNEKDYVRRSSGIRFSQFCSQHQPMVEFCLRRTLGLATVGRNVLTDEDVRQSDLACLSFWVSIAARRCLYSRASQFVSDNHPFEQGFYSLFQGTAVLTEHDTWMVSHPELLSDVVFRASRAALKLYEDSLADEMTDAEEIYDSIGDYDSKTSPLRTVVCPETDPRWRRAVFGDFPSLTSFRYNIDDGSYSGDFYLVRLVKRHTEWNIFKLNRECVRGFWASQQQEVLFLRNDDSERGSIQNSRAMLRNLINQSLDQPAGYPIYVSPITTSFRSQPDRPTVSSALQRAWTWVQATAGNLFAHGSSAAPAHVEDVELADLQQARQLLRENIAQSAVDVHETSTNMEDESPRDTPTRPSAASAASPMSSGTAAQNSGDVSGEDEGDADSRASVGQNEENLKQAVEISSGASPAGEDGNQPTSPSSEHGPGQNTSLI